MVTGTQAISLLDKVLVVENAKKREEFLQHLTNEAGPLTISFLNQHGFNLAYSDPRMCEALLASDMLLRDGVGIEIAMKTLNRQAGVNCNGSDLIPEILCLMSGRSAVIFGTQEPWLTAAVNAISDFKIDVLASRNGFCDDDVYLSDLRKLRPELILLGMGMPRQEFLSLKLRGIISHRCIIVNGGAILDFLGGRYPRAQNWIQRARLEWLFRLIQEPKRLFRRYIFGGFIFVFRIFKIRLKFSNLC